MLLNKSGKSFIGVLALSLAVVATLSGCSGSNNQDNQSNGGGNGAAQGSNNVQADAGGDQKEDKKYTISVAKSAVVPVDENGEMLKYWEEKLNVDYDVWNIEGGKWHEIMNLRFASGEVPDLMDVNGFETLQKYVKQDLLAEIPEDMLKENAPFLYNEMIEKQLPGGLKYGKVDGKLYGIPKPNSFPLRKPIVWRGDWLKGIGMDKAPETLEQFEEAMYKFALEDPDNNGKKDTYGLSQTGMESVYGAFGYVPGIWQERDGKLVYASVQPEVKEALKLLSKWYKDGVLDPEFITGENQGGYYAFSHAFFNSRIGLTSIGAFYHWKPLLHEGDTKSENYLEFSKINSEAAESLVYGKPPVGPDGLMGIGGPSVVGSTLVGFGKQLEKEPDKLAKILQTLDAMNASYEDYLTSIFGKKGEHWDYNEETGFPGFINDMDAKKLTEMGVMLNPFEPAEYAIKRAKPRFDWAEENYFGIGGISNALLSPLPSDSKYKEELKKIEDEAFINIITGDKPVDYFDEFVEKWRASGGEKLEQEANEWFANIQ
ncbi:extracellular solute-binding protein [Paenibacillus sp. J5C_2022]|nr:extracellular solute-binding protein [Paenibacillus sp. J5C2022]